MIYKMESGTFKLFGQTFFRKQQNSFDFGEKFDHQFFIASDVENGKKAYSSFPTFSDFDKWLETVPKKDRNFYEMIKFDRPRNFMMDIDWLGEPNSKDKFFQIKDTWTSNESLAPYWSSALISVTDSSKVQDDGTFKGSLHITNRSLTFKNADVQKDFISKFKHVFKTIDGWDATAYSNNRVMRMKGCCKKGSDRFLASPSWALYPDCDWRITANVSSKYGHWTLDEHEQIEKDRKIRERKERLEEIKINPKDDSLYVRIMTALKNGTHQMIDPNSGKLSYNDYLKLALSIKGWYGDDFYEAHHLEIFSLYRNLDPNLIESQLKSMLNKEAEKSESLLWWDPERCFKIDPEKDFKLEGNVIDRKDRFVRSSDLDNGKSSVIRAPMGSGKTTALVKWLNKNKPKSAIVFTPRRSFAESIYKALCEKTEFEWKHYRKMSGKIADDFIVVQVESLHRIDWSCLKREVIIADEFESILPQMCSGITHGKNHVVNFQKFDDLLKKAEKVIVLDAFLTNRSLDYLGELKIDFDIFNYTRPYDEQQAFRVTSSNDKVAKDELLRRLKKDIDKGKNIFFFSSSKDWMKKSLIPQLNEWGVKYLAYHGDAKNVTPSSEWGNFQIVCTTCTITVGVDFDREHFDSKYAYISAQSKNLVRDMFQSLQRVRQTRDKTLTYFLSSKVIGKTKVNLKDKVELLEKTMKDLKIDKDTNIAFTPDHVHVLAQRVINEQYNSAVHIEELFAFYLKWCGYISCPLPDSDFDSSILFDIKDKEEIKFEDIKVLNPLDVDRLVLMARERELTEMEKLEVSKFYYLTSLIGKVEMRRREELWDFYMAKKKQWMNQRIEKGLEGKIVNDEYFLNPSSHLEFSSLVMPQISIIRQLKNLFQIERSSFGDIDSDYFSGIMKDVMRLKHNAQIAFNFKLAESNGVSEERKALNLINAILSRWSGCSLNQVTKVRKVAGKNKKFVVGYKINGVDAYNEIRPFDPNHKPDYSILKDH